MEMVHFSATAVLSSVMECNVTLLVPIRALQILCVKAFDLGVSASVGVNRMLDLLCTAALRHSFTVN